jgi:hypothetical protein
VSGKSFDWFFTQWLTRAVPRLEGWGRYNADRKQVDVTLSQTQSSDPYRLTVDIGIVRAAGAPPRVERVLWEGRSTTVSFVANTEPASVVIDPDTWLLFDAGPFTRQ